MTAREVVFVDGVRTAFGRMGGTLRELFASQLAGIGIRGLVEKTKITQKDKVDCVFLGTAVGCSHSPNPARWAVLDAGLGYETSASYVEMQCGSAIDAIKRSGETAAVLASITDDKVTLIAYAGKKARDAGLDAGELVKRIAKVVGGGGGGRPELGQAGGTNVAKVNECLELAQTLIREALD